VSIPNTMDDIIDDEADKKGKIIHNALRWFTFEHDPVCHEHHSPVVELVVIFKLLLDVCLSIVEYILTILITKLN
jgi:hypothetical protein